MGDTLGSVIQEYFYHLYIPRFNIGQRICHRRDLQNIEILSPLPLPIFPIDDRIDIALRDILNYQKRNIPFSAKGKACYEYYNFHKFTTLIRLRRSLVKF